MKPNNYLICKPVGPHEIHIGSKTYTVLFDQYNSLGFDWTIHPSPRLPHYFQEEDFINEFKDQLNQSLEGSYSNFLFDTSGSLAVEHAIHYSQLYTGRSSVLKFRGCYHGSTLAIKQLNVDPLSLPHDEHDSLVGVAPFSYEQSLQEITQRLSTSKYACILIDPNFCDYLISVPTWYWVQLRKVCTQFKTLIVMDEMRTSFRSEKIWFTNQIPIPIDLIVGAKALSNGLPFSLTGIHVSVYDAKFFYKVNEYCTGFSYNPLIFMNVRSIFNQLYKVYKEGSELPNVLKEIAAKWNSPFLLIQPKRFGLILTLKTPKPTLTAALCEAKLKEKGVLIYRAENKFILYPHFTFPPERLKSILEELIKIIYDYYEFRYGTKKETPSY